MNHLILRTVAIGILIAISLTSCDTSPTLQSYIVDSAEKEGFITTSIPKTILGIDESKLTPDSQKAFKSINKVNVLVYPKTEENTLAFQKESEQLNSILKGNRYKTLMSHQQDGIKAKFLYQGDKDAIKEIIVFGTSDDMGMGVARILGSDMNMASMMKMMKELEKADINPAGIKGVLEGMGLNTSSKNKVAQEHNNLETIEKTEDSIQVQ